MREFKAGLRDSGVDTGGPTPMNQKKYKVSLPIILNMWLLQAMSLFSRHRVFGWIRPQSGPQRTSPQTRTTWSSTIITAAEPRSLARPDRGVKSRSHPVHNSLKG